jgi:hypothetical protein
MEKLKPCPKDELLAEDISKFPIERQLLIVKTILTNKWNNPSDGEKAIIAVIQNAINDFNTRKEK